MFEEGDENIEIKVLRNGIFVMYIQTEVFV